MSGAYAADGLESHPGTYALLLAWPRAAAVTVGRLGEHRFPPGSYVYVGSALGPGGLRARVRRHLGSARRLHWHIDYLRPHTTIREIWLIHDTERRECEWAARLSALAGARVPVPGFGASDCDCVAHLVHFAERPAPLRGAGVLKARVAAVER